MPMLQGMLLTVHYIRLQTLPSEECALRQLLILQNFECAMGTGMVENFVGQCQANNDACVVAFPESPLPIA